jgi:4-diphosphocytidyl-2-C-methyl-D-erythritol kinase
MAAVKLLAESAPAKINLFLRVTGRRADNYHELDSAFIPVALADRIRVEIRPAASSSVVMRCADPALAGDANLAVRAARAFMSEFGLAAQISIDLEKNIPIGAGLGGGSSDAGAMLRMLAALERVDAPERLHKLALALGADVPFFIRPAPARVGGIGERITPLTGIASIAIVIAAPPFEVSTAEMFRALEPTAWSGAAPPEHLEAILGGEITDAVTINDLAEAAIRAHPQIALLKNLLTDLGARAAQMTGSGGAVFGVFASSDEADRAAREATRRAPDARVFATISINS